MPKPVCVPCQSFMKPEKNGFDFIEGKPSGYVSDANTPPKERLGWVPYKVWRGDKWKCRFCGHEIVVGCLAPVALDFEPQMSDAVALVRATTKVQVNDC